MHLLYRILLLAFPSSFRELLGEDMQVTFAERIRAARVGGRVPWALLVREYTNVVRAGLHERLHSKAERARLMYWQDIRYAFRLLARSPGFSLLTVLVLAGGLGLSTFTFSFLHTAMIRPLQLSEGDRIVRLTRIEDGRRKPVDVVDLAALRASSRTVRELGGFTKQQMMLGRADDSRVVSATITEPVLFAVARTPALLGRALIAADAAAGAEPVAVLSYRMWEIAFGADRAAVNSLVTLNGVETRIVGVMPEGFGFPVVQDIWLPLHIGAVTALDAGNASVTLFGRLAPEVARVKAETEVSALLQRSLAARDSGRANSSSNTLAVESFPAAQIGEERTAVFASLNFAAALILLLALVNVVNLLTARANERVRETAVRLALGASTGRLIMQGMWEGVMLCLAGGFFGTAAASWGLDATTRWTRANMPESLAFWWVWQMDRITLLSAGAFVTIAIAVLGSVVTVRAMRTNVRQVMQDGSARAGSRREGRLARGLVVLQVTAVTVLMYAGVLSGVMAERILSADTGYDLSRLLQVELAPPVDRVATDSARAWLFLDIQSRLTERSAVQNVLIRTRLARAGSAAGSIALRNDAPPGRPSANILAVLGDMTTLNIHLVDGRMFTAGDDASRTPVVLISRTLAERDWRGRSPIGDQLRLAGVGDTVQWRTIVGVVSDIPYGDMLSRDRSPQAIYVPLLQGGVSEADIFVRYRNNEMAARQALNESLGAIDAKLVPGHVYRAAEVVRKGGMVIRGLSRLLGGCFAFALVLAVVGTYGLMSRAISQRTREIGVRRALGASERATARMLLMQGARQLGIGTLVAAPVLAAMGVAATQLFPISGLVTASVGVGVSASIVMVVLAATWIPTRSVLRVALRDALWRD